MKKCPYCAEEIQDNALKCRYCGEFLKKKKKWMNCLWGCLTTCLASIILFALFIFLIFSILKFVTYKIFFSGPGSPHYYPPFTGQGLEGMLRDFCEVFRALWERLRDFLHSGTQNYRQITF